MTSTASNEADQLAALIGPGKPKTHLWIWALLVAVVAIVIWLLLPSPAANDPQDAHYVTESATTGDFAVTVSATGNLQPTNQIDVGSELSGIVAQVLVDVNGRVAKGDVLASLDQALFEESVARAQASLEEAKGQLGQAQATQTEAAATLARLQEVSNLSAGRVPSKTELDASVATARRAAAGEQSAQAQVSQARAALQTAQTNLKKSVIRSPIDGVVLARNIDPGQTVAASFQAPVLFTIAEDLTKMELQVDVDEADVGQVKDGQSATFAVDAWPGRTYKAVITRVSFGSETKDGVVSYPTVLEVENPDLSLRPGMTATAEITVVTRKGVLLVPNAALRFDPTAAKQTQASTGGSILSRLMPRPPASTSTVTEPTPNGPPRVWVLRNGSPVEIRIQTGVSDGRVTEVVSGDLQTGANVITQILSEP